MNNIYTILDNFKKQKILILGEAFLDAYLKGFAERICREAPVPIIDITKDDYAPGGAANAAANATALSAQTYYLSVIGTDSDGRKLLKTLKEMHVSTDYLIENKERKTIAKKRIIADGQMVLRFDTGTQGALDENTEEMFLQKLVDLWDEMDAIVISDYGYGIITDNVIKMIQKLQTAIPKILIVDSKYLDRFRNSNPTVVKPNYKEAVALLGLTKAERGITRIKQMNQYKEDLLERTNANIAAVTLDAEGALLFDRDGPVYRTYADKVENPNVSGAGDTYAITLALSLACGADIKTAAEIAANATKVIVRKHGTAICNIYELRAIYTESKKIVEDRNDLQKRIAIYREQGKKIIFSNGCFDILHSGHVTYLNQAKSYGDVLILGVNTDESIKAIKGPGRPINKLLDRMSVLTALSSVDITVPMPEETACQLVELIQPDIYVKGGDYTIKTLPEAKIVLKYGGKIELIPTVEGRSTTGIINKIQKKST